VLAHHPGTYAMTRGWWSLSGVGGHGDAAAGFLIAVFMFTGWDGTLYVNEEVRHRRINPGRAALLAVCFLAVIYTLAIVGLQGVVSPEKLQARDALILGLLPLGAAGFLGWMLVRTLQNSPSTQRWSLIGIVALGLVMLLIARFVLRSPFFSIRRESDTRAS
jgi:amino acid transporter